MGVYTGSVLGITPSSSDDNWTLDAGAGESGEIIEFSWGGVETTTQGMTTRIARSSGAVGSPTLGNVAKLHPNSAANLISFVTTYATTQPTLDAGDLFATSWNAHGGVVVWKAIPGEELIILGAETVSCRTSVGTGNSSYHVIWAED